MGVEWSVLGPETVRIDGVDVDLNLRPRTVLLRLLQDSNRSVSWEKVAAYLWGDEPPKTQRNSIARFVADLRRALGSFGDRIVTEGGGYSVVVGDGELDIERVRVALRDSKELAEIQLELAHDRLAEASDLAGLGPNPWLVDLFGVEPVLLQHEELQIETLESLAELKLRTGRTTEVVALLEQGIEVHPYNENLWAHLVVGLHRSGRTADALRACQRLRGELAEIGLEPGEAIRRLESRIVVGAPSDFGPTDDALAGSPAGRDADLRAIGAAIAAYPLVTVIGVPGSGKSQLAAAAAIDEELEGVSVYRIDLRPLRHASRVIPTIAAAIGVPASEAIATADALAAHLTPVSGLIVLDNCEHLRPECATFAAAVTERALGIRILVTSREPLRIDGEHAYRLEMLPTDKSGNGDWPSPAAALFVGRSGDDEFDDVERRDIEAVCTAVLGNPAAIELAAGLWRAGSIAELRAGLEAADAPTPATAPAVVLDIAWGELAPAVQALLARLSVFVDGCPLAGAEAVCGESGSIQPDLEQLVERGLVQRTADDRFVLDASVREFAASRLSERRETSSVLDRLVAWLTDLVSPWTLAEIASFAASSRVLLPEQANLSAALAHLRSGGRMEELGWLAIRSCGLWINHGMHGELVEWLSPIVEDETLSDPLRSATATAMLEADLTIGEFATMNHWGEMAVDLARGEPHDWIPALTGFLALWSLMAPKAMSTADLLDVAEDTARKSESPDINLAHVFTRRAQIAHHVQKFDEAVAYFRQGLVLVPHEGRLLLALEMGETISLYVGGRREEALESVHGWRSKSETDEWHYQVALIRAIVVGGCGEPEKATADLAETLRRQKPVAVWARADEFQIAFGLLAAYRGEPRLSEELLATAQSGSPFLSSIVFAHQMDGADDSARHSELAMESRLRTISKEIMRSGVTSPLTLVNWWRTGEHLDEVEPV